mgnify:CR=1 FL=1|jgi:hypothetical protein
MKEYQLQLLLILALAVSLMLSACAGVDASVLDSAQCKGKGVFGSSIVYTMGINVPELIATDESDFRNTNTIIPMQFLEFEYGVQDDVDAKLRFGFQDSAASGKILIKKQMLNEAKRSTAIVAGVSAARANNDFWEPVDGYYHPGQSYSILSAELQGLLTRIISEGKFLTMALRGNVGQLKESSDIFEDKITEYAHAGVRLNYMRYYKGFYSVFEIGAETPLITNHPGTVYPWFGMKFGMDFTKRKN